VLEESERNPRSGATDAVLGSGVTDAWGTVNNPPQSWHRNSRPI
jgi:hypothetical protein